MLLQSLTYTYLPPVIWLDSGIGAATLVNSSFLAELSPSPPTVKIFT